MWAGPQAGRAARSRCAGPLVLAAVDRSGWCYVRDADSGSVLCQLFFYRSNSPSFSSYFIILISLPLGRWLAKVTPKRTVRFPLFGDVALNPGPFNIK